VEIVNTEKMSLSDKAIQIAVELMGQGEVVLMPSENTYGFFTNALMKSSVEQIYNLKQRDFGKPLGYYTNKREAERWGKFDQYSRKVLELWPCAISIIVPKYDIVPDHITAGYSSLLLVCPDVTCEKMVDLAHYPIACTSANISGHGPLTSFQDAVELFEGKVPLIVDGGESARKANGTIIDFSRETPTILRVGPFPVEEVRKFIPHVVVADKVI
jgi:L-threonylcarbamoyladenylate synthase